MTVAAMAIGALALVSLWLFYRTPRRPEARPTASATSSAPPVKRDAQRAVARRRADEVRARLRVLASAKSDTHAAPNPSSSAPLSSTKDGEVTGTDRDSGAVGSPWTLSVGGIGNAAPDARAEYVRSVVHEQFIPMAGSCYDELLARRPDAHGLLNLHIVIGGHPSVGGVVENVEILPDTTIRDAAFDTCMIESMMAVQFDAPPTENGHVDIIYPFNLAPDPPDAH